MILRCVGPSECCEYVPLCNDFCGCSGTYHVDVGYISLVSVITHHGIYHFDSMDVRGTFCLCDYLVVYWLEVLVFFLSE